MPNIVLFKYTTRKTFGKSCDRKQEYSFFGLGFQYKISRCKPVCWLFQDHVLIQLEQTGLKHRKGAGDEELVKEDDPILVVHPNYVIDS